MGNNVVVGWYLIMMLKFIYFNINLLWIADIFPVAFNASSIHCIQTFFFNYLFLFTLFHVTNFHSNISILIFSCFGAIAAVSMYQ